MIARATDVTGQMADRDVRFGNLVLVFASFFTLLFALQNQAWLKVICSSFGVRIMLP